MLFKISKPIRTIILMTCLWGFCSSVYALRCGTTLIHEGDSSLKVETFCGAPESIVRGKKVRGMGVDPITGQKHRVGKAYRTQIWTYNFGPTDFLYQLTFKQGQLIDIKTNGYGHVVAKKRFKLPL